jgi:hypothetical protein
MSPDRLSALSSYDVLLSYNSAGRGMVEKIGEEELDRTNFSGARSFGCGILRREALPISGDLTPAVLLHPI